MSGGNDRVWMHNAELDRTIPARRSQISFMGDAGWVEVPEPPGPEPEEAMSEEAPEPSRRARPTASTKEND